MTTTQSTLPRITTVLDEYFANAAANAKPRVIQRLEYVRRHLEHVLDVHSCHYLSDDDHVVFVAEQEFEPVGAFARSMAPEDLFYALQGYLKPERLLPDLADARCQVRVAAGLAKMMWEKNLLPNLTSGSCVVLNVQGAIIRARKQIAAVSNGFSTSGY